VSDDANQLFNRVWDALVAERGQDALCFPAEIMWLGGAPGSGKGTMTAKIMAQRGFTGGPVVMSSLLTSPEMQAIKDAGKLVGDEEVLGILLRELLQDDYRSGVVVDGFPRTPAQVGSVRQLHQRMQDLHDTFAGSDRAGNFPAPVFSCTVLHVSEEVAVKRQLGRGAKIKAHNEQVDATGVGTKEELRATDVDPALAGERYQVFVAQSQAALESLREFCEYHFIDGNGTIPEVERQIAEHFSR
jgi:adenylate kinase